MPNGQENKKHILFLYQILAWYIYIYMSFFGMLGYSKYMYILYIYCILLPLRHRNLELHGLGNDQNIPIHGFLYRWGPFHHDAPPTEANHWQWWSQNEPKCFSGRRCLTKWYADSEKACSCSAMHKYLSQKLVHCGASVCLLIFIYKL